MCTRDSWGSPSPRSSDPGASQPPSGLGSKPKSWVRGEWVNKMAFVSQLQEPQGPFPPVVRGFLGASHLLHTCRLPHFPLKEPASFCFLHRL